MKKIIQTNTSPGQGNCFIAALASVLEVPLKRFDHVPSSMTDRWFWTLLDYLTGYNITLTFVRSVPEGSAEALDHYRVESNGYVLICWQVAGATHGHETVWRAGKQVHDPYPGTIRLTHAIDYCIVAPHDPAKTMQVGRLRRGLPGTYQPADAAELEAGDHAE